MRKGNYAASTQSMGLSCARFSRSGSFALDASRKARIRAFWKYRKSSPDEVLGGDMRRKLKQANRGDEAGRPPGYIDVRRLASSEVRHTPTTRAADNGDRLGVGPVETNGQGVEEPTVW